MGESRRNGIKGEAWSVTEGAGVHEETMVKVTQGCLGSMAHPGSSHSGLDVLRATVSRGVRVRVRVKVRDRFKG